MKLSIFAALSLSAMAFSASAQSSYLPTQHQPSFDFVQAAYQSYSIDGHDDNLDGFALQGSFSLTEQIFIEAHYEDLSSSFDISSGGQVSSIDSDTRFLFANIGYQFYQQGSASIYAAGGLAWSEFKSSGQFMGQDVGGSDSDTGFNLVLGARYRLSEHLEFDVSVRHIDVSDDSDQHFTLSGRYYFTPRFSLDARYTRVDSDFSGYAVGASFHF